MLRTIIALLLLSFDLSLFSQAFQIDTFKQSVAFQAKNLKVINQIVIVGNKTTKQKIILRELEFKSGDIVNIDIPEIDINRFIVMQRMIIIGPEIKFNYKLKGIE